MSFRKHILPLLLSFTLMPFLVVGNSVVVRPDTITLAFVGDPKTDINFRWIELIYIEAFRRLNIRFEYDVYPPLRASKMANTGRVDGEAARVAGYGQKYENLVRVDEPIALATLAAYATKSEIELRRWEDLQDTHYRVEYHRGMYLVQQRLAALVPEANLTQASYPVNALKKLIYDRIDLYIDIKIRVDPLLKSQNFSDSPIRQVAELERATVYAYLHRRHGGLAVLLTEVLKAMRAEGVMEELSNVAIEEFLHLSQSPDEVSIIPPH